MNVADHALARRNRARENVFDGMAGLVLRDGRIGRSAEPGVAERRVGAGMQWIAVVRVNHVAGRASAAAIVARMIVRAGKRQDGVEQSGFLQAEKNRIGA